ncbi:hypothetical protein O3301_06205 [Janthinobacterium sp. SUN211]|uniref:hypothetical protein n=1 Tax=Janthinobacterium sp. SUN211 TaxID=3014786 RepID=UPI00271346B9|nr:hypothetical protein [Janthinobacterium sp. SUN211]MDO8048054.1 hypothetical protein [Janthinobacterium sp. SUN211]
MIDLTFVIFLLVMNISILAYGYMQAGNYFTQLYLLALLFVNWLIFSGYIAFGIFDDGLIFISAANFICVFFVLLTSKVRHRQLSCELAPPQPSAFFWSVAFALLALFYLVQGIGGVNALFNSWVEIKDDLDGNNLLRNMAMFFYIIAVASLRSALIREGFKVKLALPVILIAMFVMAIRVKLFMLPLFLTLLLPRLEYKLNNKRILWAGILFPLLYLSVMVFRWLGDLQNVGPDELLATVKDVLSAGVEREMYHQFHTVFEYFQVHSISFGASYQRLFLMPMDSILGTSFSPDNPMYSYYTIQNNGIFVEGGSAHPSLYGDSFASFSVAGIFIPGLIVLLLNWIFNTYRDEEYFSILFVGVMIFIGLVARGAVFYAFLYLIFTFFVFLFFNFWGRYFLMAISEKKYADDH